MAPKTPTRLLTVQEAAARHGIPKSTLFDLIARGALPCVRFPEVRRVWIKEADIDQLIERSVERAQ